MVIIRRLIKLKQVLHTLSIFQRFSTGCLVFLEIWTDIEVEFLAHCQHIDLGCAVEDLGKADVVGLVVGIWNGNHIKYGLNDGVLTKRKQITDWSDLTENPAIFMKVLSWALEDTFVGR